MFHHIIEGSPSYLCEPQGPWSPHPPYQCWFWWNSRDDNFHKCCDECGSSHRSLLEIAAVTIAPWRTLTDYASSDHRCQPAIHYISSTTRQHCPCQHSGWPTTTTTIPHDVVNAPTSSSFVIETQSDKRDH